MIHHCTLLLHNRIGLITQHQLTTATAIAASEYVIVVTGQDFFWLFFDLSVIPLWKMLCFYWELKQTCFGQLHNDGTVENISLL